MRNISFWSYGKRYYFLSPKIWIWETLLSVTFLMLCIPIRDYSSYVNIFALDFRQYLKNAIWQVCFIVYIYFLYNSCKNQRYTLPFTHQLSSHRWSFQQNTANKQTRYTHGHHIFPWKFTMSFYGFPFKHTQKFPQKRKVRPESALEHRTYL